EMIEQPLPGDDLLGHARVQAELTTPICLDETVATPGHARQALALGSGRVINIKPGRLGGLGPALAVHDLCRAAGAPVWCGGLLETGVGRAHNVALATLPGLSWPGELAPPGEDMAEDHVQRTLALGRDGYVTCVQGPRSG